MYNFSDLDLHFMVKQLLNLSAFIAPHSYTSSLYIRVISLFLQVEVGEIIYLLMSASLSLSFYL